MALTLVVCVGAFTMIYAQLEPVVSDFVGRGDIEVPTPVPTQEPVAQQVAPTATSAPAANTATEAPPADDGPTEAAPRETPPIEEEEADGFDPDFQIDANGPVNLRPGPGVGTGDAITALPVGTPLMYLDEEQVTSDPNRDDLGEGDVWMRFETEEGQDGWIREVDVSEFVP